MASPACSKTSCRTPTSTSGTPVRQGDERSLQLNEENMMPLPDDPFLRMIFANRDDDVPRLVYADWLEERGDSYGEFIRVQVELAHLGDEDGRRPELLRRQAD